MRRVFLKKPHPIFSRIDGRCCEGRNRPSEIWAESSTACLNFFGITNKMLRQFLCTNEEIKFNDTIATIVSQCGQYIGAAEAEIPSSLIWTCTRRN
jgi:hypothetical protein